jgi:hypothetical protein
LLLAENIEGVLLAVQGFDVPLLPASFLVVSTPEEEQALNETIMEQQLLTEPTLDHQVYQAIIQYPHHPGQ